VKEDILFTMELSLSILLPVMAATCLLSILGTLALQWLCRKAQYNWRKRRDDQEKGERGMFGGAVDNTSCVAFEEFCFDNKGFLQESTSNLATSRYVTRNR
jgi:hypothetical protein